MADWKRVPVEPTEEMVAAAANAAHSTLLLAGITRDHVRRLLRIGIAAAPPDEEVVRLRGAFWLRFF